MFVPKYPRLRLGHSFARPLYAPPRSLLQTKRTYFATTIQTLSNGVLDLAIALPYPASFPPYSTTIILLTVVTRLVFTVPFSLLAKKLQWKTEDILGPRLPEIGLQVSKRVRRDMARERVKGSKDELNAIFQQRCQQEMTAERKKLLAENRLSPTMIMAIPALTQLPVFVLSSLVFTRITQAPSGLDAESLWTLTSLVNPDPTATIPVVIGLITLANVESSHWFITDAQKVRQEKVEKWNAEKRAQGHVVLEPKKLIQNGLRLLSVGRILVASMVPGAVEIYWLTSTSFGLLQSWAFDYWERGRAMRSDFTKHKSKPLRII